MNVPDRILQDDGDHPGRAMLQSALGDGPSPASKKRIKATLAGGAAVAVAGALGHAGASKGAAWAAWAVSKWMLIAASVGAVALGGAHVLRSERAPAAAPTASSTQVKTVVAAPPSASAAAEPSAEPAAAVSRAASPSNVVRAPRASLAQEQALIDEARTALAGGDAIRAIAVLDRHDAEYPSGVLATESLMLRVEALVRRGDRAAAMRVGKPFCDSHPKSPQARRLRTVLGLEEGEE